MKAHILKGSKQEIAAGVVRITGEVREAIVFEDEPVTDPGHAPSGAEDIFAEMRPYEAEGSTPLDDSREAIYTRLEGE